MVNEEKAKSLLRQIVYKCSKKIIFDESTNCNTCKYGYFEGFDATGWHNMCEKWNCYLCQSNCGYCYDYEKGTPPENKQHI